MVCKG